MAGCFVNHDPCALFVYFLVNVTDDLCSLYIDRRFLFRIALGRCSVVICSNFVLFIFGAQSTVCC